MSAQLLMLTSRQLPFREFYLKTTRSCSTPDFNPHRRHFFDRCSRLSLLSLGVGEDRQQTADPGSFDIDTLTSPQPVSLSEIWSLQSDNRSGRAEAHLLLQIITQAPSSAQHLHSVFFTVARSHRITKFDNHVFVFILKWRSCVLV